MDQPYDPRIKLYQKEENGDYFVDVNMPEANIVQSDLKFDINKIVDCLSSGVQTRLQNRRLEGLPPYLIHINESEAVLGLVNDIGMTFNTSGFRLSCQTRIGHKVYATETSIREDCTIRVALCFTKGLAEVSI